MACSDSVITLDTSALERLISDPQGVLDSEQSFWSSYRAQVLTKSWADAVDHDAYTAWRAQVKAWAELPLDQRRQHVLVRNCEAIVESRESFARLALPHICSYLPPGADLSATIYFTAFIPPRAFAIEDVVINVAAKYWNNDPANILNQIVHEVGHVGHSYCREAADDYPDETIADFLRSLQGEGFCTYIAYQAQHLYPAPDDADFHLADDPEATDRLFCDLNEILAQAGVLHEPELRKLAWDKGVMGRAYYVPGMHMCRLIEERLGRAALIQSMIDAPSAWVRAYNQIAPADRRVGAGLPGLV